MHSFLLLVPPPGLPLIFFLTYFTTLLHDLFAFSLRFKITLEAQTAAMQRQDETPVTYLNKGEWFWASSTHTTTTTKRAKCSSLPFFFFFPFCSPSVSRTTLAILCRILCLLLPLLFSLSPFPPHSHLVSISSGRSGLEFLIVFTIVAKNLLFMYLFSPSFLPTTTSSTTNRSILHSSTRRYGRIRRRHHKCDQGYLPRCITSETGSAVLEFLA